MSMSHVCVDTFLDLKSTIDCGIVAFNSTVHTAQSSEETYNPDSVVAFLLLVGAYIWVRIFDFFTSKRIVGQKLSRKIVHITSGLLYMLCWPLFSSSPAAPFIAGIVPLANGIRLLVYGTGILKDEGLVQSMSRTGDPKELLRGPLYYVVVLYTSTVVFWRQSPVGMIALGMMCGGDGIADIMGRKFGSKKLPYNPDKSWAGSVAMLIFGFLVSFGLTQYFSALGFYQLDKSSAVRHLALISLAATVTESLPISTKLDDNFTIMYNIQHRSFASGREKKRDKSQNLEITSGSEYTL
ncbi:hypothetical protein R1sor_017097 [Riccia sorocarpa]|uniref:phytol kinase n=1 Tax=Riccia sorocarpa TaxID=122646 RepID=A0ABD3I5U2_9MARC